jgi:hypothetical protein
MSTTSTKKTPPFSKIECRADALKVIKESSIVFLVINTIWGALNVYLFAKFPSSFSGFPYDAALYIFLALMLMFLKSRIAAVLLLFFSGVSVVTTILNILGITNVGGINIFLALALFWATVKAVEATFKLHGRYANDSDTDNMGSSEYGADTLMMPEEPTRAASRFTTLEWFLIVMAGWLAVMLLVIGYVVIFE